MKKIGIFLIVLTLYSKGYSQTSTDNLLVNDTILTNTTLVKDSTITKRATKETKSDIFVRDTVAIDSMHRVIQILLADTIAAPSKSIAADSLSLRKKNIVEINPIVLQFNRFLYKYRSDRKEWCERWDDIYLPAPDIRSNADYYKLSMPATYYSAPIEQAMSIEGWTPKIPFIKENVKHDSLFQVPHVTTSADIDRAINKQLLSFYLQYPNLVNKNEMQLKDLSLIHI
mgnify:FL=1